MNDWLNFEFEIKIGEEIAIIGIIHPSDKE